MLNGRLQETGTWGWDSSASKSLELTRPRTYKVWALKDYMCILKPESLQAKSLERLYYSQGCVSAYDPTVPTHQHRALSLPLVADSQALMAVPHP